MLLLGSISLAKSPIAREFIREHFPVRSALDEFWPLNAGESNEKLSEPGEEEKRDLWCNFLSGIEPRISSLIETEQVFRGAVGKGDLFRICINYFVFNNDPDLPEVDDEESDEEERFGFFQKCFSISQLQEMIGVSAKSNGKCPPQMSEILDEFFRIRSAIFESANSEHLIEPDYQFFLKYYLGGGETIQDKIRRWDMESGVSEEAGHSGSPSEGEDRGGDDDREY